MDIGFPRQVDWADQNGKTKSVIWAAISADQGLRRPHGWRAKEAPAPRVERGMSRPGQPPCRVAQAGHSKGTPPSMLRPRQALLVERSAALVNTATLSVGPTGSGKTIMLSAVAGSRLTDPRCQGLHHHFIAMN